MQSSLLNIIMEAYNNGFLQYDDMSIFGITIHMDMHRKMNKITMSKGNKVFYTMLYDSDLESTTESGMAHLLALVI